ncbi:hypothetical protein [Sinorhizobium fredii]|uniref:hypothetical protein n=1 Tax=Rhizobium fredii TaxID=380 RepID=UPI00056A4666|nr:hypothetical protein [Sinorhizobium fredii]
MLLADAFLRQMPSSISVADRLRFEAIVTSCDVVEMAFRNLEQTLTNILEADLRNLSTRDITAMSMACWTIVDHVHVFLQFARKQAKVPGGILDAFQTDYGFVTQMRNAMDHLHANIRNAAERKGAVQPLHGSVTFSGPIRGDGTFEYIIVPLATMHRGSQLSPVIDTYAEPPASGVGNISFAAFDWQLSVTDVVVRLADALQAFNASAEHYCRQEIERIAPEHGLDPEELWDKRVKGNAYVRLQLLPRRD